MVKRLLFILGLCVAHSAAAHEWTDAEKYVLGASTAALVVDWGQTRRITTETERVNSWRGEITRYKWHETNPLLGQNPSPRKVNNYFALAIIGNYFVADNLEENRMAWLLGVSLLELAVIIHNRRMGVSWGF